MGTHQIRTVHYCFSNSARHIYVFHEANNRGNVTSYIEYDLKNIVFDQYQRLTQRFFKQNNTGDLMNRISEDVGKVRMYVGPAIMYALNTGFNIIVISIMLSVSPKAYSFDACPSPSLLF